jgi:apolipoprotein N-acyltransferase
MFNLTNDSWYGNTVEPMEHLVLASFRAIEHRRSLVRVTNTGVSAFVDPVGRIVRRTGVWTRESLADRIPLLQGSTVYSLLGDWIGWFCAILSVFCIVRAVRVPRPREETDRPHGERAKQQTKRSPARKPPARRR